MKKLIKIAIAFISISMLVSCDTMEEVSKDKVESSKNTLAYEDNTKELEVDKMNLLTCNELIELCNLSEDEYNGKNLNQFIHDYSLSKENVNKYNIHALLENYEDVNNVEYLFNDNKPKRNNEFTNDIVAIAFKENINTTMNSVYIDVENKEKWAYKEKDVFFNLNDYNSESFSTEWINALLEKFEEYDLFNLENKSNSEEILDSMSFCYVIKYNDGTYFSVERSGIPAEICPEYYTELREMLFSDDI